jgi:hypothetical protein
MNPDRGGFAAAVIPATRRARLRGRPSGLKGRCHDRYATGLRPALDPGASTAPHRAAAPGRRRGPLPAASRGAQRPLSRSNPYKQVSTVPGDCPIRQEYSLCDLPIVQVYLARERARHGDRDDGIAVMRAAVDHLFREGRLLAWGIPATGVLVETLLDRGADADVAEAETAIERLAAAPADEGLVIREIWLLRLRAMLARAHGDQTEYRDFRDRYRDMAKTLGFEGHIVWAQAMP